MARATESWVAETTVVEVTVMSAPKEALAPAWKFVPVTVTVKLAPGAPEPGDTLAIVGVACRLTVAVAELPSASVTVREKLVPSVKTEPKSDANTKRALPSATGRLTVPSPALSRAPSGVAEPPRAQCGAAGSGPQTPPASLDGALLNA